MTVWLIVGTAIIFGTIGWNAGRWVQHSKDEKIMHLMMDLTGPMIEQNICTALGDSDLDRINSMDKSEMDAFLEKVKKGIQNDIDSW